jgi:hypothetical protein
MSAVALVILALLWAAVLVPDFIQRSQERSRSDSIGSFSRQLSTLSQTLPSSRPGQATSRPQPSRPLGSPTYGLTRQPVRTPRPPMVSSATQKRRQDVMTTLVTVALMTFLGAVSVGGIFFIAHVLVDVALVAYLGLLLFTTRKAQVRAQVTVLYSAHERAPVPMAPQRQRVAR